MGLWHCLPDSHPYLSSLVTDCQLVLEVDKDLWSRACKVVPLHYHRPNFLLLSFSSNIFQANLYPAGPLHDPRWLQLSCLCSKIATEEAAGIKRPFSQSSQLPLIRLPRNTTQHNYLSLVKLSHRFTPGSEMPHNIYSLDASLP